MTTPENLGEQIERVVQAHIAASRAVAVAALSRAFGAAMSPAGSRRRMATSTPSGQRRTEAEVAALSEHLYREVCARPGESMAALAIAVDSPGKDLLLPMEKLRQAGRVRSVGQRRQMRYFPLAK